MIKLKSDTTFICITGLGYYSLTSFICGFILEISFLIAQAASIFIFLFYLVICITTTYNFLVENNSIKVTNQLRPFYTKKIDFGDIEDVKVKGIAYRGLTLVINLKHKSKEYFAVNRINKEELEEIVAIFKAYKSENTISL